MKQEVDAALDLLTSYIQRFGSIEEETIKEFRAQLQQALLQYYENHWYPGKTYCFSYTLSYYYYYYYCHFLFFF